LIKSRIEGVYFKDESRNPTGSFRDRAATLIVSHAVSIGTTKLGCATDGNHGASIAAYCAKSSLKCYAITPSVTDIGKKVQMEAYGCEIEEYGVTLDEALDRAISIASRKGYYQASAELNTLSIEGLKTISYEIFEQYGGVPSWVIVPVGSGITIYSIYKGFLELKNLNLIDDLPRLLAVQSKNCAPIASKIINVKSRGEDKPIMGLNVYEPILIEYAIKAIRESKGYACVVSYREAVNAAIELAKKEGLFVELAAASSYAGYKKAKSEGLIGLDEDVIVLIPSSGLKAIESYSEAPRRKQTLMLKGLDTKAAILKLLKEVGPLHGYSIWKKLGITISPQAIYQHLDELERSGFVESKVVDRRKVYKLTSKGEVLLSLIKY